MTRRRRLEDGGRGRGECEPHPETGNAPHEDRAGRWHARKEQRQGPEKTCAENAEAGEDEGPAAAPCGEADGQPCAEGPGEGGRRERRAAQEHGGAAHVAERQREEGLSAEESEG